MPSEDRSVERLGRICLALPEVTEKIAGLLVLVAVSPHGVSPLSRRSGITSVRYVPSAISRR